MEKKESYSTKIVCMIEMNGVLMCVCATKKYEKTWWKFLSTDHCERDAT